MSNSNQTSAKKITCDHCGGAGWFVDGHANMFASTGRLALRNMLPTKDCPKCKGEGKIITKLEEVK